MEEKIREATDDEKPRAPAPSPRPPAPCRLLRDRLTENDVVQAQFMLVFDVQLFEPHATPWWTEFATMDRGEFEKGAADLVGPRGTLAMLRQVAAASASGASIPPEHLQGPFVAKRKAP